MTSPQPATRRPLQPPIRGAQLRRAASKGTAAWNPARHHDRPPGSLPGWSALILQHGAKGTAVGFQEYRIIF